tara:strand:- start:495 stop:1346 length:852 start_codon:yes stop_codon:yes gene_type:complete
MLLSEIYKTTKKKLDKSNIETSEIDARAIIRNVLGYSDKEIIMNEEISLSKNENDLLSRVISERLSGKPISKIFGSKEFFSMDFKVNEYVLDPRPESEILVEVALDYIKKNNFELILEFGVGSGCIIAGILKNAEKAYALGVDISEKAVNTAKTNLHNNKIKNFDLIVGDWGLCINRKFDLIISNPPYIKTDDINNLANEVKKNDPLLSLDGGSDGLNCYRAIAGQSSKLLNRQGFIIVEIGFDQAKNVEQIFFENNFLLINKVKDISKLDRVLIFMKKKIKK